MAEAALAVIDPTAIRHNLERIRKASTGCRIMAVIKANGYGHGLIESARLLDDADALAVARVSEGIRLRQAGVHQRIVLLEGCSDAAQMEAALQHRLDIVVHDPVHFGLLDSLGNGPQESGQLDVWLKLDSGMGRLGFPLSTLQECRERLAAIPAVSDNVRLLTHLANADDPDDPATLEQVRQFGKAIGAFKGDVSIANSAGILMWPQTLESSLSLNYKGENWVRPGIALFGASPVKGKSAREMGLRPAMSFESRLIAVKTVKRGKRVGYGGDWQAARDTVVGVAAVGYADGYPRHLQSGTPVLVNGRRVALIGRVSMDMINLDLTDVPVANVGDRVVLWGGHLPVEEVAARAGTIPWELMCGLSERVEHEYSEPAEDAAHDSSAAGIS